MGVQAQLGLGHWDCCPSSWRPISPQDSGGIYHNESIIQCSSPVFLSISVIDQPDLDPQFVREFYSASVAEDAPQVCQGPGVGSRWR